MSFNLQYSQLMFVLLSMILEVIGNSPFWISKASFSMKFLATLVNVSISLSSSTFAY